MTQVLILDDDEKIRDALRYVLEDAGYTVVEASGVITALEILRAAREGMVVLVDLLLADGSGTDLLDIAARDSVLAARHAYILTSSSVRRWEIAAKYPFMHQILSKPFELDDLLSVVARAVNGLGA